MSGYFVRRSAPRAPLLKWCTGSLITLGVAGADHLLCREGNRNSAALRLASVIKWSRRDFSLRCASLHIPAQERVRTL